MPFNPLDLFRPGADRDRPDTLSAEYFHRSMQASIMASLTLLSERQNSSRSCGLVQMVCGRGLERSEPGVLTALSW